MGTFSIPFGPDFPIVTGDWKIEVPPSRPGFSTYSIQSPPLPSQGTSGSLNFSFSRGVIFLDGDTVTPLTINGLPSGFRILSAKYFIGVTGAGTGVRGKITVSIFPLFSYRYLLEFPTQVSEIEVLIEDDPAQPDSFTTSEPFPSSFLTVVRDNLKIYNLMGLILCKYRMTCTDSGSLGSAYRFEWPDDPLTFTPFQLGFDGPNIEGVYDIWSSKITVSPTEAAPGDEITISDGNKKLDEIEKVAIIVTRPGPVYEEISIIPKERTPGTITFPLPPPGGTIEPTVIPILFPFPLEEPPEEEGPILTQPITITPNPVILPDDTTGLYTISPDKRDDTIYDRDNTSVVDVAIPIPFVKIGFFRQ